MHRVIANTMGKFSAPWMYILTASAMLAIVNIFIGAVGPFSPAALRPEESAVYLVFGGLPLLLALAILKMAPRQDRPVEHKDRKIILSATGSLTVLSIFAGVIALYFSIPTLDNAFGREMGHLMFLRVHSLASAVGLLVGLVGVTISLHVYKRMKKKQAG